MDDKTAPDKVCVQFDFYRKLSVAGKDKFRKRVQSFRSTFKFIPRQGLKLTDEIEIYICAVAAQITFGFKKYKFPRFRNIHVYPGTYYSSILNHELKGGTDPKGVIHFSWDDLKDGYADDVDKINLGMHEFAHALMINLIKGTNFDPGFASYFDRWFEIAKPIYDDMQAGNVNGLRKYAAKNLHEFFAVFVEHFFEHPEDCKSEYPDAYNHCCILFNIDPENVSGDYRITTSFREGINSNHSLIDVPYKIKRTYRYDGWHWSTTLIALGLFAGIGLIAYFISDTVIKTSDFILLPAIIFIVSLAQWPYFRTRKIHTLPFFLLYCLLGNGILITGLLLTLNFAGSNTAYTETYNVVGIQVVKREDSDRTVKFVSRVVIDDPRYDHMPKITTCRLKLSEIRKNEPATLELQFKKGLFGYPVVVDRKLKYSN